VRIQRESSNGCVGYGRFSFANCMRPMDGKVRLLAWALPRQRFICLNPYSGHAVKKYVKEDIS